MSGFLQEYGEDPRTLDEWDERWLRYRFRALTAFVRELRAELDSVGRKAGRRIALSADTFALPAGNLYYGLDDGEERTLEEIGSLLGVTRERIRQIKERALQRLRHATRSGKLSPYLRDDD